MQKRCYKCGATKGLAEFGTDPARPDGIQNLCRDCKKIYNAEYYLRTKDRHNPARAARRRQVARGIRERLAEYLRRHPCVDCGETDIVVLQFDHQRDKVADIHRMITSLVKWERIAAEIDKCEVVCANDHHRRTAKTQGWQKALLNAGAAERR